MTTGASPALEHEFDPEDLREWFAAAAAADPTAIGKLYRRDPALVEARDMQGRTALHIVATLSAPEAAKAANPLIAAGVPIDTQDRDGHSALYTAIAEGRNQDLALFLLDAGADTSNCLHPAIEWGDAQVLDELIECGADIDEQLNSESPLAYARRLKRAAAVRLLEAAAQRRS